MQDMSPGRGAGIVRLAVAVLLLSGSRYTYPRTSLKRKSQVMAARLYHRSGECGKVRFEINLDLG